MFENKVGVSFPKLSIAGPGGPERFRCRPGLIHLDKPACLPCASRLGKQTRSVFTCQVQSKHMMSLSFEKTTFICFG